IARESLAHASGVGYCWMMCSVAYAVT
ncbi:MAG: cell division inhibitor SidA, partial [Caulobacterales bacterium]|nr:cell division inhibitor SidA [Caulobacterales bacterium]